MSTEAQRFLRSLRAAGVTVEPDSDRLAVDAPSGLLDSNSKERLKQHKSGIREALTRQGQLLALPLHEFERAGHSIEFRLPGHDGTFWLVPTHRDVEILLDRGTPRGRIWTVDELRMLLDLPDRVDAFHDAIVLKLAANGPLVATVRDTGDVADA